MFKVNNIIYECEIENEKFNYEIDNKELEVVLSGKFKYEILTGKIFNDENININSIKLGDNKNITNKITSSDKKEIIKLILEDIADIYEISFEDYDYDIEYKNIEKIKEIIQKYQFWKNPTSFLFFII